MIPSVASLVYYTFKTILFFVKSSLGCKLVDIKGGQHFISCKQQLF